MEIKITQSLYDRIVKEGETHSGSSYGEWWESCVVGPDVYELLNELEINNRESTQRTIYTGKGHSMFVTITKFGTDRAVFSS